MRESPLITLIKIPWWLNLMIGLGMMSLGQLLKAGSGDLALIQRSFGDGLQIVSVFFVVLALASFMIGASNELSGERRPDPAPGPARPPGPQAARQPGAPPVTQQPPQPQAPPPPPKKKYTERDFMPPAMRNQQSAGERKEDK